MALASFIVNKLMPLWLMAAAVLAYTVPQAFTRLAPYSAYCLGGVILVMSLTLTIETVAQVFTRPKR